MNWRKVEDLARECGEIMTGADRSGIHTDAKAGHANFVTQYDVLVQERIREGLGRLFPEAGFFGEEGAHDGFPRQDRVFIVDPIDGTTNFLKGLNMSAIAISCTEKGERVYGLVYNPFTKEMFTAQKGQGAYLNGTRIRVSPLPLREGVVLFGTAPYYPELTKSAFEMAYRYMDHCIDVRRFGSAELDLCYVACGRAELYFEPLIQPWDFAAGSLIVEEAGGTVSQMDGTPLDITKPGSCVAYGSGCRPIRE